MTDEKITVPSILSINIIFLTITAIYLGIKSMMPDNSMLSAAYLIIVLFTQYFYNMWIILGTHKTTDTTMALTSLIFWVIFVVLYIIINMGFPAWKTPFANTIGYAIADMIHPVSEKFKDILKVPELVPLIDPKNPINVKTPEYLEDQQTAHTTLLAIRYMRADPHWILTKATSETYPTFLEKLKDNKVFKDGIPDDTLEETFKYIGDWYKYKDLVAEGVWLALAGSLTIAVTYYYIVSAPISSSPAAIEKSNADTQAELNKESDDSETPNFVTVPTGLFKPGNTTESFALFNKQYEDR
jgi:hypothetical protein